MAEIPDYMFRKTFKAALKLNSSSENSNSDNLPVLNFIYSNVKGIIFGMIGFLAILIIAIIIACCKYKPYNRLRQRCNKIRRIYKGNFIRLYFNKL